MPLKSKFIQIWRDPVGSKIIATFILAILSVSYNLLNAYYSDTNFIYELKKFLSIRVNLWLVILIYLILYISTYYLNKKEKFKFIYDTESIELDKKLFEKIRNELLTKETLDDLYNHTFSNHSFERAKFDFIHKITKASEDPEFEFLNPELENLKVDLVKAVKKFQSSTLGTIYSAPSYNDIGFLGIPREWDAKKFYDAIDKIEPEETNVFRKAELLIKTSRRILKI